MSYSITFSGAPDQEEPETFFLCSIGSWSEFCQWANRLPKRFNAVKSLATYGVVSGTDRLSEQLFDALEEEVPSIPVHNTIAELLDNLGIGDAEETATITD